MKDLRIIFTTPKGNRKVKEYDTIMDFIKDYEDGNLAGAHSIYSEFFENVLHQQRARTIKAFYLYCKSILK